MNPSQALAAVLVDELVRGGVRDVVLSPGSRNAPLSYALHEADRQGRLRLHVRIDERSAGFLALGLAKASGLPVMVTCTSGTAVANLHPAMLEASHSGLPLLAFTADRPAELWGTGANQTADQVGIFGSAVRATFTIQAPERRSGQVAGWRSLVCRALATAAGELSDDPGPVQVDVAFRDPLVPDAAPAAAEGDAWPEPLGGRVSGEPWTRVSLSPPPLATPFDGDVALGSSFERTLMVVGDCQPETRSLAAHVAMARGWPLVAEPSGVPEGVEAAAVLPHGVLLLGDDGWLAAHRPQRVLVVGHVTLSRPVQRLLADPEVVVEVVTESPRWPDAGRQAAAVHARSWLSAALRASAAATGGQRQAQAQAPLLPTAAAADDAWAEEWRLAAQRVATAVAERLQREDAWPSGAAVAAELAQALPRPALLVLGSSSPIRDVDLAVVPRPGLHVLANRGLAGIDGVLSTAQGAALAVAPGATSVALVGDLTFLHDSNGLVVGPDEPRAPLTVVVVNDDGGSIFGLLEQGAPELEVQRPAAFERVFGTPHGADLAALCASAGAVHVRATTRAELRQLLAERWSGGVRVVEVVVDRTRARGLAGELRRVAAEALAAG